MPLIPLMEFEVEPLLPISICEGACLNLVYVTVRMWAALLIQRQHHALHILVSRCDKTGDPAVLPGRQWPLKSAVADSVVVTDQSIKGGFQPAFVTVAGRGGEQQVVAEVVVGSIRCANRQNCSC